MDSTTTPLAIVVPTHSSRELTLRCRESVRRGAVSGVEVILVDGASGDGTAAAVRSRLPQVAVLRSEANIGFSAAVNLGLGRAHGDAPLLLNIETERREGAIESVLEAFASDPGLGIAGAVLEYPDGSPQWSAGRRPTPCWLFVLASGLGGLLARLPGFRRAKPPGQTPNDRVDWVTGAAMAVRRQAWEEIGPLDEAYHFYCQDLDLCLAAGEAGWKVALLPRFRVVHHHGASISATHGAIAGSHPELLWSDLLRWFEKRRGAPAARRARRALRLGGRLRVLARRLVTPLVPPATRPAWRADTAAFARALADLERRV